jgi:predicted porin
MKKTLLALAVIGATAGIAQAQTSVTIYGQVDVGVVKVKNQTTAVGRGDNNKLGFKGVEDLGGGLSAIFQIELRYEPDTGTTESAPNRPLFQGQTRVGLKGDFGTIRIGRGLTTVQEEITAFEPYGFVSNRATLSNFALAGYNGDPLVKGSSQNRFSNAIFYNTPNINGFKGGFSLATKEPLTSADGTVATPKVNAYSVSAAYENGPFAGLLGYERNALDTKFYNISAYYKILPELKLIGSYARQKLDSNGLVTKGTVIGTRYTIGPGDLLFGYGRNKPDNTARTDQYSLGYEYNLSKRTFLYLDGLNRRSPGVANINQFDLGISHKF